MNQLQPHLGEKRLLPVERNGEAGLAYISKVSLVAHTAKLNNRLLCGSSNTWKTLYGLYSSIIDWVKSSVPLENDII